MIDTEPFHKNYHLVLTSYYGASANIIYEYVNLVSWQKIKKKQS